jgi:hypothetical protein
MKAEAHRLPDGTWQGYHRGWKVLNVADMDGDMGWGVTDGHRAKVCYNHGVLGVFIARRVGTRQEITLHAKNSMYSA